MSSTKPLVLDGKHLAQIQQIALKQQISKLTSTAKPHLLVILVGEDPASQVYVSHKVKACEQVGMHSSLLRLSIETSQEDLLNTVKKANLDQNIHGILIQLPLPKHLDTQSVLASIDPAKDVDGFHAINAGLLFQAQATHHYLAPCTPSGCMDLLAAYDIPLRGQHAVIVGASNIVGKPMAMLLLQAGATVTICNSKTPDIGIHTKMADIIVMAAGVPQLLKSKHVKKGAVVIDVGIHRLENGLLCGDVDASDVMNIVDAISPVPGGVGPMTIAKLLNNTYQAFLRQST